MAKRCLVLRETGKAAQAKAAEAKAKYWLAKAMALEALTTPVNPTMTGEQSNASSHPLRS